MKKIMSKIALSSLVASILAMPAMTMAAWTTSNINTFNLPNKSISDVILQVTNWLVGFIIILAFLIIVYGGVRYVAAAGLDDEVAEAKKIITYGVIGLVIAGLSWVIVYTVINVVLT